MTRTSNDPLDVAIQLDEALQKHGYGFQHAVSRVADRMESADRSKWTLVATEYPVAVNHHNTHIDLVLKHKNAPLYLVGECKRADPALARWCFARAPYTRHNADPSEIVFEEVARQPYEHRLTSKPICWTSSKAPFQIPLELKTKHKGDGHSSGRTAIIQAVNQVVTGVGGLLEHFRSRENLYPAGPVARIIPAVFTTAELWTTDRDLSDAEIDSGNLTEDTEPAVREPWIWFNYNVSPTLRADVGGEKPLELEAALRVEYMRTIAIVSSDGIEPFLAKDFSQRE